MTIPLKSHRCRKCAHPNLSCDVGRKTLEANTQSKELPAGIASTERGCGGLHAAMMDYLAIVLASRILLREPSRGTGATRTGRPLREPIRQFRDRRVRRSPRSDCHALPIARSRSDHPLTYDSLQGRSAFVTGAASGNGLAIARRLEREGVRVAYVDIDGDGLDGLEVAEGSVKMVADIADPDGAQTAVHAAGEAFGSVNILVNNAGIVRFSPFDDLPVSEWHDVMNVNATGPLLVTQAAAPLLRQSVTDQGSDSMTAAVINITSIEAELVISRSGHPQVHYNASKGALKMLSAALALELAESRVRVNAIAPGYVVTPFTAESLAEPEIRAWALDRIPLGRFAAPDDVANAAAFLSSEESSYITGTTITVDGGWSIG